MAVFSGNGSSTAPSFTFSSDTNTGIYRISEDTLAVSSNGVERVRFGGGTVEFNTGSEDYDFRVNGDITNHLFFVDAGNNRVGIANSAPTTTLHVKGLTQLDSGGASSGLLVRREFGNPSELSIRTFDDPNKDIVIRNDNSGLRLLSGSAELAAFSSTTLLLGTSSGIQNPSNVFNTKLQVYTTGNHTLDMGQYSNTATGPVNYVLKSRGTSIGSHAIVSQNDSLGNFSFGGSDGATFKTAASISSQVDGIPGETAGAFAIGVEYRILTTGTTNFTLIGAANSNPGTVFTATGVGTGTGTAIRTIGDMPGRLTFATAPEQGTATTRMTIKSSGIVNIATTPTYADNAAAIAGGLLAGDIYRKSDGTLMIRF